MKKLAVSTIVLLLLTNLAVSKSIIIGGKNFTEQYILVEILKHLFEAADYQVTTKVNILTKELRPMLLEGEVDVYWEYTGTAYTSQLRIKDPIISAEQVYFAVKERDFEQNGVTWLNRSTASNGFQLVVRREFAKTNNLSTYSDLAQLINRGGKVEIGGHASYYSRPDGFVKLANLYGFKRPLYLKHGQLSPGGPVYREIGKRAVYPSLARQLIDVGMGFGTDPQTNNPDLVFLDDDKNFAPKYNPTPIILQKTLESNSQIAEIANKIGPEITHKRMVEMNYAVEFEKKKPSDVALTFLEEKGLL